MKKIIALTLVLILAVGLFAGCKSSDKGSVYFLNFKPEADSAWQALAKTYTEKTGVTVKVVTAASGTYETTLTAEMAKKDAPTLFQCGNETALDTWKDYCLALDGTKFLNEMTTSDFNIKVPRHTHAVVNAGVMTARPTAQATATRPSASSSIPSCWKRQATLSTRSRTSPA